MNDKKIEEATFTQLEKRPDGLFKVKYRQQTEKLEEERWTDKDEFVQWLLDYAFPKSKKEASFSIITPERRLAYEITKLIESQGLLPKQGYLKTPEEG